jgi:hypothetical protein
LKISNNSNLKLIVSKSMSDPEDSAKSGEEGEEGE